jgi:hypothetical protein
MEADIQAWFAMGKTVRFRNEIPSKISSRLTARFATHGIVEGNLLRYHGTA